MPTQDTALAAKTYDRLAKAYDLIADSSEHTSRETGQNLLQVHPGERVLEVGFGTGHGIVYFAQTVGSEGRVFGIDISPGMLAVAQKRVDAEGLGDRVELQVGDAHHLPQADHSLDAIFLSFTLELFDPSEIPSVLAEFKRVLRPGGRLGVVSLVGDHPDLMTHLYRWMHRHFPHFVDCQPIDAAGLVEAAGFKIVAQAPVRMWGLSVLALVATT